jgi:hypothetical protein
VNKLIEHYIRKIVDEGDQREMEKLSDILSEVIDLIKDYDEDAYRRYKLCLYKMAYGNRLTKDMAEEIVDNMAPVGEKWTLHEAEQLQRDYGLDNIDTIEFYAVLNYSYNDFRDVFGDNLDMYIRYTQAFINDEDARPGKVAIYLLTIPK